MITGFDSGEGEYDRTGQQPHPSTAPHLPAPPDTEHGLGTPREINRVGWGGDIKKDRVGILKGWGGDIKGD